MTKKEMFAHIATVNAQDSEIVEFCNKEIEMLEARKASKKPSQKQRDNVVHIETIKGIPDPEFVAVKDGVVYAADRTFGSEKVYVVKDGKATALDQPKGAIAPYNIALF